MPKYDYKCENCDHRFETTQSMSDAPLTECPECNDKIRRVISAAGVMFKGTGFYINDCKSGSKDSNSCACNPTKS